MVHLSLLTRELALDVLCVCQVIGRVKGVPSLRITILIITGISRFVLLRSCAVELSDKLGFRQMEIREFDDFCSPTLFWLLVLSIGSKGLI